MNSPSARNTTVLNGQWKLQPSNDGSLPSVWNHSVPVPALVDACEPRYDWKDYKYHWYKTEFITSASADLAFVVIDQAMFGTDVWLNGKPLGCDIACYTSQEYDARGAWRAGEKNELVVRVGQRENLPPHNAAGKDQERTEWIPGIWGDVYFVQCGNPRVKLVQVIPHIAAGTSELRITVENLSDVTVSLTLRSVVCERQSKKQTGAIVESKAHVIPLNTYTIVVRYKIPDVRLWSPDDPFLYEAETFLFTEGRNVDALRTTFGMREFSIAGRNFHLNGKKILLKGGNIAFHRFLSDADRGTLPWRLDWVKKLLIDIPKENNFNLFRNHIGQMYNRWYDLADEHGMLLQNEWMFWKTSGSKEQIMKEFTRWLQDNWNHPSIVIWDALNECSDNNVQKEIVPAMKQLDPTRPWESVDFVEEHPYIYSLGPVLNDRKLGFTRSLADIENSATPTMLNEFCWWWLDKEFRPSLLTKEVVERWLGPEWSQEQLIAHQSYLMQELVELFRRMKVDAIQPFVYLSNNAGPTANWFKGDIKDLQPKPILETLKNAFAPVGVSVELWDRHFFANERRTLRVFVFNDQPVEVDCTLRCGVVDASGEWLIEEKRSVVVAAVDSTVVTTTARFPSQKGEFKVRAEVSDRTGRLLSCSEKRAHVFPDARSTALLSALHIVVAESGDELRRFLTQHNIRARHIKEANLNGCDVLIAMNSEVRNTHYQSRLEEVAQFIDSGKTVIVIEPEFGIDERELLSIAQGIDLEVEKREDKDKGGYDSYIFADDISHPLWEGILPEHLKMFNGGYGGEVVSEHNVSTQSQIKVHARCGLQLRIPAIFEIRRGSGRVIISRLQLRGRLVGSNESKDIYSRRPDPVLQQFVLNLVSYASNQV